MPEVSIILPVYNRETLVGRAVISVLMQSFGGFELIVVDDGSTDKTAAAVSEFSDKRIIFLKHEKNAGSQAARNTGIKKARGKFIGFIDSDDEWHPEKLSIQMKLLNDAPAPLRKLRGTASPEFQGALAGTVVAHSAYRQITPGGIEVVVKFPKLTGNIYKKLLASPGPVFPALLARKECFEKIGLLDETQASYQEWDLSIKLARHYEFAYSDEPLITYHLHGGKTISKNNELAFRGYLNIVEKNRMEILKYCGRKALGSHYLIICRHAYESGDRTGAKRFFIMSVKNHPLNLKVYAYLAGVAFLDNTESRDKVLYFSPRHWIRMRLRFIFHKFGCLTPIF